MADTSTMTIVVLVIIQVLWLICSQVRCIIIVYILIRTFEKKTVIFFLYLFISMLGQWYSRACDLEPIVDDPNKVLSSLRTIYEYNVIKFGEGGLKGAVNGLSTVYPHSFRFIAQPLFIFY